MLTLFVFEFKRLVWILNQIRKPGSVQDRLFPCPFAVVFLCFHVPAMHDSININRPSSSICTVVCKINHQPSTLHALTYGGQVTPWSSTLHLLSTCLSCQTTLPSRDSNNPNPSFPARESDPIKSINAEACSTNSENFHDWRIISSTTEADLMSG